MNKLFHSVLTGALRNQHTKILRRLWELSVSPTTWRKSSWSFWFVNLLFLPSETCFFLLEICFIQRILLSVPLMHSDCAWLDPVSYHFVDNTFQSLIVCVNEVLIAVSVGEWGHNKEGQYDEWHALQEPPHQAVSHAEERRGQQAAGGRYLQLKLKDCSVASCLLCCGSGYVEAHAFLSPSVSAEFQTAGITVSWTVCGSGWPNGSGHRDSWGQHSAST